MDALKTCIRGAAGNIHGVPPASSPLLVVQLLLPESFHFPPQLQQFVWVSAGGSFRWWPAPILDKISSLHYTIRHATALQNDRAERVLQSPDKHVPINISLHTYRRSGRHRVRPRRRRKNLMHGMEP